MPRRAYPSDLSNAEWVILEPLIPPPKPGGRPVLHPRRELVDAMCYVLRTGCAWRLLPHDFPPGKPSITTSGSGARTADVLPENWLSRAFGAGQGTLTFTRLTAW